MFLDSKLDEPQLISIPKFLIYHSFVACRLSEQKKMPPIPVTFAVVSAWEIELPVCFFSFSIILNGIEIKIGNLIIFQECFSSLPGFHPYLSEIFFQPLGS